MRYASSFPIVLLLAASSWTVSSAVRLDDDEEVHGQNSSATETILALDEQMQSVVAKLGKEIEHSENTTSVEHGQAGGAAQHKPKHSKKDEKKPALVPPSNPAVQQLWKYLKDGGLGKYDRDLSGTLNVGEFRELCHDINPTNPVAVADSDVEEVLENFDSDKSGCINVDEALEFVRQDPTGSRPEAPSDDCTGWSPSTGQDKGKGGSCEKWGWQNFWCYVPKGFEGPGKQASLLHPGKFFASCGVGKEDVHNEDELLAAKQALAAKTEQFEQKNKEVEEFKRSEVLKTEMAKTESVEALQKATAATAEAVKANRTKLAVATEAAEVSQAAMKANDDMKAELQKTKADCAAKVKEANLKESKVEEQLQQLQQNFSALAKKKQTWLFGKKLLAKRLPWMLY